MHQLLVSCARCTSLIWAVWKRYSERQMWMGKNQNEMWWQTNRCGAQINEIAGPVHYMWVARESWSFLNSHISPHIHFYCHFKWFYACMYSSCSTYTCIQVTMFHFYSYPFICCRSAQTPAPPLLSCGLFSFLFSFFTSHITIITSLYTCKHIRVQCTHISRQRSHRCFSTVHRKFQIHS